MLEKGTIGWDLTVDDCVQHALTVGMALRGLGKEVTPEAVLEALAATEPNGWIGKMLSARKDEWADELIDFEIRATGLAARLKALEVD